GNNRDQNTPTLVTGPGGQAIYFTQVALGGEHSAALTADGQLYTWGPGGHAQLGHGDNRDHDTPALVTRPGGQAMHFTQVALGSNRAVARTPDGQLYTWGLGGPQLGLGDKLSRNTPTLIGGFSLVETQMLKRH